MDNIDFDALFKAQLVAQGDFAPCFAFSVHKAGSSLMNGMLEAVAKLAGLPSTNVPDTMFNQGLVEYQWGEDERLIPIFQARCVHFGFRAYPSILSHPAIRLQERKSVLLLRDPRDALVSQYYSWGAQLSHAVPANNQDKFFERVRVTGPVEIDDYVIKNAPVLKAKMDRYRTALTGPNVRVFHYEDVFFDKYSFITDIFSHFGIAVEDALLRDVAQQFDVRPEKEDPSKHIRRGFPGDHLNKLQPETIRSLDALFF